MTQKSHSDEQRNCGVNGGKVGHKNPPKSGQFSRTNQPDRAKRAEKKQRKKEAERPVDPIKIITEAIYEKVGVTRNGKASYIPFIEAFIESMKKNAFSSKLHEQIKFMRELIKIGVFQVEEYKQRLRRNFEHHYQKEYDIWNKLSERVVESCEDSKLVTVRFQMLLVTSSIVRIECTCGAAERCFSEIDKYCLAGVLDVPDEFDPFGCGTDDVESNVAEAEARAADKELRSGMFGDGDDG